METETMTLTEFLLARVAEDEERHHEGLAIARSLAPGAAQPCITVASRHLDRPNGAQYRPGFALAECAAKRQIVERCTTPLPRFGQLPEDYERVSTDREDILRALALPYADHADYRPEWTP